MNKLYAGVRRFCSLKFDFCCFTEDGADLDPAIKVIPLKNQWKGWWSKVNIFDSSNYDQLDTRVFYLDLDMIISGDITQIAQMPIRRFATLSTDEIYCENVEGGYNSSIMVFNAGSMSLLYDTLVKYHDHLLKYLMRFDHFLEMLVWDATLV